MGIDRERYSPLMLTSDHNRILGAAQERYDTSMADLYERGRWDGVVIGLMSGAVLSLVLCLCLLSFMSGWL